MSHSITTPRVFKQLPTADTSLWRAAGVYAKALIGAVSAAGVADAVLQEFDSLVHDVLDASPKVDEVFSSQFVDEDAKVALIDKAFSGKASPLFLNFLKVVAKRGRLDMLRLIRLAAHEEFNRVRGRVRVMVSSAEPLGPDAEQRIAQEVRQRLHLEPVLDKQVHPELIGGIVLRVGDRVFDGSIATQLAKLREKMLDRSVHEIQSRRDRFSSAEGN